MAVDEKKWVFISHSHVDDAIGVRLYTALESQHIKCWYSSRPSDLEPGKEWDDNIVEALNKSVAVVLLFSKAANASKWVKRELAMAGKRDITIYPVRIEDIEPTGGIEAHLISVQWTNALDGNVEKHIEPIIRRLQPFFPLRAEPERLIEQPDPRSRPVPLSAPRTPVITKTTPVEPTIKSNPLPDPNPGTPSRIYSRYKAADPLSELAVLIGQGDPFYQEGDPFYQGRSRTSSSEEGIAASPLTTKPESRPSAIEANSQIQADDVQAALEKELAELLGRPPDPKVDEADRTRPIVEFFRQKTAIAVIAALFLLFISYTLYNALNR